MYITILCSHTYIHTHICIYTYVYIYLYIIKVSILLEINIIFTTMKSYNATYYKFLYRKIIHVAE